MLDFIINRWDDILVALTSVVTAASAVCALTPSQTDDKIIARVRQILDVLALNVGQAKTKAA